MDAIRFARKHAGEWVLVRAYKNSNSATAVASTYRKKYPSVEFTTRYAEMFIRVPGVETK